MAVVRLPTDSTMEEDETIRVKRREMITQRYEVIRPLGEGGMGIVYEAEDRLLRRRVALKLIRRETKQERAAAARLIREARVMAALEHDHVVSVYDVGTWLGRVFIAMQMIEGTTLRQWAQAAPRTNAEKLRVLIEAGRGLAAAHACHIVHRDFKPDNVLVDSHGVARVTDFGIARQLDCTESEIRPKVDAVGDTQLTQSGAILGTPAYMAPEHSLGGDVTEQADQFAFCVAAWELFAGHRPFAGVTISEVLTNKMAGEITPTSTERWPAGLESALRRGFAVDPGARYPSLDALIAQLEQISVATPRRRRRFVRAATIFGATVSAAALSVLVASTSLGGDAIATRVEAAPAPTPVAPIAAPGAAAPSAAAPIEIEPITLPAPAIAETEVAAPKRARATRKVRAKASPPAPVQVATVAPTAVTAAPAEPAPAPPDTSEARAFVERELSAIDASRTQRHLWVADVPGYAAARDRAIAAAKRGDLAVARDTIASMREKVAAVRIDKSFVDAKTKLLGERVSATQLDQAQSRALQSGLTSAMHASASDQFETANRHLTAVGKLLGIR
jgi:tRNA A-37 threonylcarbamoyl transferase component Bud32